MKCPSYNLFFKTVSNRLRIDILGMLKSKSMNVTELTRALKEEQSKISHNLKKLVDCNIVTSERKGKEKIYSLNKNTIIPLLNLVEEHVKCYCGKNCRGLK